MRVEINGTGYVCGYYPGSELPSQERADGRLAGVTAVSAGKIIYVQKEPLAHPLENLLGWRHQPPGVLTGFARCLGRGPSTADTDGGSADVTSFRVAHFTNSSH